MTASLNGKNPFDLWTNIGALGLFVLLTGFLWFWPMVGIGGVAYSGIDYIIKSEAFVADLFHFGLFFFLLSVVMLVLVVKEMFSQE
jgi:hypothetical protein